MFEDLEKTIDRVQDAAIPLPLALLPYQTLSAGNSSQLVHLA
jgi:hypothetical protein